MTDKMTNPKRDTIVEMQKNYDNIVQSHEDYFDSFEAGIRHGYSMAITDLQQLQAEQQLSGNHSKLDIVSEQPILTYEQGLERGRQIGHKEGWRDAKAEQPKRIDINEIIENHRYYTKEDIIDELEHIILR